MSPILAFVVPPAGAVLGHLALPQIRRTGEHGRWAAIWALILRYALSLALAIALVAWGTSGSESADSSTVAGDTEAVSPPAPVAPPSVVTSVAPAPVTPRKLDLSEVPVGTCAHIEKRDVGNDALDLFATSRTPRRHVHRCDAGRSHLGLPFDICCHPAGSFIRGVPE